MKKRLFKAMSLLMTVAIICTMFSAMGISAFAEDKLAPSGQCGENVFWSFDSATGTVTLSGSGDMGFYEDTFSPFTDNDTIKKVVVEKGVTSLVDFAFFGCKNLSELILGESLKLIGNFAFEDCTALKKLNIPGSVVRISDSSFMGCSSLEEITVDSSNMYYSDRDGSNAIIDKQNNILVLGCKNTEIPEDVVMIGDDAFEGCTGLTGIEIPKSVKVIGSGAFSRCTSLNEINIPAEVTALDDWTFSDCTALKSINIPASVSKIGFEVFAGCTGLEKITVDGSNKVYDSRNNCNAIIEKSTDTLIVGCKNTVIPASVTTIGEFAFYNCTSLKAISIPDGVTAIEDSAFCGCEGLTSVIIPGSVKKVNYLAFGYCTGLTNVVFSSGVNTIDERAFEHCQGLISVVIPVSVKSIAKNAFNYCSHIKNVYYAGTKAQWKAIKIDAGNKRIKDADIHYNNLTNPVISLTSVAKTGKIKISWNQVDGADKYEVYRATAKDGAYKLISTTAALNFTDTSAVAGNKYYYKVKAVSDIGAKSGYSGYKYRTCDLPAPTVKGTISNHHPKLSWDKVSGAVSYKVYRSTSQNGTYKLIFTTTNTTFTNTSIKSGKYYYKVSAVSKNTDANSAQSGVVALTAK